MLCTVLLRVLRLLCVDTTSICVMTLHRRTLTHRVHHMSRSLVWSILAFLIGCFAGAHIRKKIVGRCHGLLLLLSAALSGLQHLRLCRNRFSFLSSHVCYDLTFTLWRKELVRLRHLYLICRGSVSYAANRIIKVCSFLELNTSLPGVSTSYSLQILAVQIIIFPNDRVVHLRLQVLLAHWGLHARAVRIGHQLISIVELLL